MPPTIVIVSRKALHVRGSVMKISPPFPSDIARLNLKYFSTGNNPEADPNRKFLSLYGLRRTKV